MNVFAQLTRRHAPPANDAGTEPLLKGRQPGDENEGEAVSADFQSLLAATTSANFEEGLVEDLSGLGLGSGVFGTGRKAGEVSESTLGLAPVSDHLPALDLGAPVLGSEATMPGLAVTKARIGSTTPDIGPSVLPSNEPALDLGRVFNATEGPMIDLDTPIADLGRPAPGRLSERLDIQSPPKTLDAAAPNLLGVVPTQDNASPALAVGLPAQQAPVMGVPANEAAVGGRPPLASYRTTPVGPPPPLRAALGGMADLKLEATAAPPTAAGSRLEAPTLPAVPTPGPAADPLLARPDPTLDLSVLRPPTDPVPQLSDLASEETLTTVRRNTPASTVPVARRVVTQASTNVPRAPETLSVAPPPLPGPGARAAHAAPALPAVDPPVLPTVRPLGAQPLEASLAAAPIAGLTSVDVASEHETTSKPPAFEAVRAVVDPLEEAIVKTHEVNAPIKAAKPQSAALRDALAVAAMPLERAESERRRPADRTTVIRAAFDRGGIYGRAERGTIAVATTATSPVSPNPASDAVARIAERMELMVGRGQSRAELEIRPAEWGGLHLSVDLRGDSLSVRIVAETEAARAFLQSEANALRRSLESQGYELTQIDVSLSDERRSQQDRRDPSMSGRQDRHQGAEHTSSAPLGMPMGVRRPDHDGAVNLVA